MWRSTSLAGRTAKGANNINSNLAFSFSFSLQHGQSNRFFRGACPAQLQNGILRHVASNPFGRNLRSCRVKRLYQNMNPISNRAGVTLDPTDVNPRHNASIAKVISSEWLYKNLDNVTVLDVRGTVKKTGKVSATGFQDVRYEADEDSFLEGGHIPDARFVDWRQIKVGTDEEIKLFCEDILSPCGVHNEDDEPEKMIAVYDWGNMLFATRLWLALTVVGCKNVGVLNGGWHSWNETNNYPISYDTECPLKLHSNFEAVVQSDQQVNVSVALQEMREIVGQNLDKSDDSAASTLLIDARSIKQFTGMERRNDRGGHIPTAINFSYRKLINDDGVGFRDDESVSEMLNDLVFNGSPTFFDSFDRTFSIRNYCGSFNEWGNLPDVPVEV